MLQGRHFLLHPPGEPDEVEGAEIRLHEIKRGAGEPRELADLDLAVLRHRAHRDDAGLVAGRERDDRVEHRAHLEHRALAGLHSQIEQRRAQALGALVELPEAELALFRGKGDAIRHPGRGAPQSFADREVDPQPFFEEIPCRAGRRVNHAFNHFLLRRPARSGPSGAARRRRRR